MYANHTLGEPIAILEPGPKDYRIIRRDVLMNGDMESKTPTREGNFLKKIQVTGQDALSLNGYDCIIDR